MQSQQAFYIELFRMLSLYQYALFIHSLPNTADQPFGYPTAKTSTMALSVTLKVTGAKSGRIILIINFS